VVELRSSSYDNEIVLPDGTRRRRAVAVRIDPFTGHVAHLISGPSMLPDSDADLDELAATSRDTCPFCPERIDKVTATLPPEIWPGGRIRVGDAVLFANLVPVRAARRRHRLRRKPAPAASRRAQRRTDRRQSARTSDVPPGGARWRS